MPHLTETTIITEEPFNKILLELNNANLNIMTEREKERYKYKYIQTQPRRLVYNGDENFGFNRRPDYWGRGRHLTLGHHFNSHVDNLPSNLVHLNFLSQITFY
jgi:hypothetical protein